jgi:hypothetical protein
MSKSNSPRTWLDLIAITLVAAVFLSVTDGLPATPSDEINRALAAQGAASAKQAKSDVFLDALASVLVSVDKKQSGPYLDAAIKERPDLKAQISATSTEVYAAPNDGTSGVDHRVSRHRRRCTICHRAYDDHRGVTLILPCPEARRHLENHPHDTRGPCPE